MKLYKYPGHEQQKQEHKKFNEEFNEIKNDFKENGYSSHLTIKVQRKVCD